MLGTRTVTALAVAVGLVVGTGTAATGWLLVRDDAATRHGTCDGAVYELDVEPDDGTLEVSFEMQSLSPGETWSVAVQQGGTALLRGERTTDDDAELDVDVYADPRGGDSFAVAATSGDRTCSTSLTR